MRNWLMRGAVAVGVVAAAGVSTAAQQKTASRIDLSGVWNLNRELSDNPQQGPGDSGTRSEGRRGGGGGGGYGGGGGRHGGFGGGGRGGMGGGSGRDGTPEDQAAMQQRREVMHQAMEAAPTLTITQEQDAVVFTEADGRMRRYVTNDKEEKHQLDAGTVATKSHWDEQGQLVIQTTVGEGMKIVQTYALDPNDRRLVLTTKVDSSRSSRQMPPVRRVYEPAATSQ